MIKDNEHFLHNLNGALEFIDGYVDLSGKFSPSCLNVLDLIDVKGARVRSKLGPDLFVENDTSL